MSTKVKAKTMMLDKSGNKALLSLMFLLVLIGGFIFSAISAAHAQSAAERNAISQVETLLNSAHSAAGNLNGLSGVVRRHFAIGTWTNAVLGKRGREFSGGQKAEFRRLFPTYVAKQYFKQFGGAGSNAGSVTKARTVRGDVLVESRIPGRSRTFTVVWRTRVIGGKPRIIDYSAGGISTVVLRRSEFQSKIKQSGPSGLNSFIKSFIAS